MKAKSQLSIRNIRNKGTQPPRLADARQPTVVPSNAQVSVLPRIREDVHRRMASLRTVRGARPW